MDNPQHVRSVRDGEADEIDGQHQKSPMRRGLLLNCNASTVTRARFRGDNFPRMPFHACRRPLDFQAEILAGPCRRPKEAESVVSPSCSLLASSFSSPLPGCRNPSFASHRTNSPTSPPPLSCQTVRGAAPDSPFADMEHVISTSAGGGHPLDHPLAPSHLLVVAC